MEKRWSVLWEKLRHGKKNQWLIVILSGVLLLVIAIPTKEKEAIQSTEAVQRATDSRGETDEVKKLERELTSVLEQVKGVGKTKVMITGKSSGEKIVEKDRPLDSSTTKESGSQGEEKTVEEKHQQESTVYIQEQDGDKIPYVIEERAPKIEGVLVIAQGGDDPVVVKNITEAVMALFGVEAHKIKVMKMD